MLDLFLTFFNGQNITYALVALYALGAIAYGFGGNWAKVGYFTGAACLMFSTLFMK